MLTEVQPADFATEVLQADRPVLVDFFSQMCFPCRQMFPLMSEIQDELNGDVKIVKFDAGTEAGSQLAAQYGVRAVPNFVLFRDGKAIAQRMGSCPKKEMRGWIDDSLL